MSILYLASQSILVCSTSTPGSMQLASHGYSNVVVQVEVLGAIWRTVVIGYCAILHSNFVILQPSFSPSAQVTIKVGDAVLDVVGRNDQRRWWRRGRGRAR